MKWNLSFSCGNLVCVVKGLSRLWLSRWERPVHRHTATPESISIAFQLHPFSFFRSAIKATGSSCQTPVRTLPASAYCRASVSQASRFPLEGNVTPLSPRPQNKRGKRKRLHGSGLGVRSVCLLHCSLIGWLCSYLAALIEQDSKHLVSQAWLSWKQKPWQTLCVLFYFPGKLSGGPDTLWTKPTRAVWLIASAYGTNRQGEPVFVLLFMRAGKRDRDPVDQ